MNSLVYLTKGKEYSILRPYPFQKLAFSESILMTQTFRVKTVKIVFCALH